MCPSQNKSVSLTRVSESVHATDTEMDRGNYICGTEFPIVITARNKTFALNWL